MINCELPVNLLEYLGGKIGKSYLSHRLLFVVLLKYYYVKQKFVVYLNVILDERRERKVIF